jgi:hypothetical protein
MTMTPQQLEAAKAWAKSLIDACTGVEDIARIHRAVLVLLASEVPPPTSPVGSP